MTKVRGERLEWNKDSLLKWEDFQAKPMKAHFASALSDISFLPEPSQKKGRLYVRVVVIFNQKYSWVKEEEKSENLLKHEQTHFDIFEIYARLFRKELSGQAKFKATEFGIQVQKLSDKYFEKAMKEQEKYEEETAYSTNKEKQKEWNQKVANELKELENYSIPTVEITNIKN